MQIEGLGEVRASEPERVMLRMRGASVTVAGWRIAVEAPRGPGSIVLAEQGAQRFYRGEGVFLGWPQERLEATYRTLLPPSDGAHVLPADAAAQRDREAARGSESEGDVAEGKRGDVGIDREGIAAATVEPELTNAARVVEADSAPCLDRVVPSTDGRGGRASRCGVRPGIGLRLCRCDEGGQQKTPEHCFHGASVEPRGMRGEDWARRITRGSSRRVFPRRPCQIPARPGSMRWYP